VSSRRKQESRKNNWIPAFAGMTYKGKKEGNPALLLAPLPSRRPWLAGRARRGGDLLLGPPHPTLSTARGEEKTSPFHSAKMLPEIFFVTSPAIWGQLFPTRRQSRILLEGFSSLDGLVRGYIHRGFFDPDVASLPRLVRVVLTEGQNNRYFSIPFPYSPLFP